MSELQRWSVLREQLDHHFKGVAGRARASERASVRVPTRLRVSFESLGNLEHSFMTNLSQGGMYINPPSPLEIGSRVTVRVRVEETGEILEIPGEVVSNHVGSKFTTGEKGMGICFLEMEQEVRDKLDSLYEHALKLLEMHPEVRSKLNSLYKQALKQMKGNL